MAGQLASAGVDIEALVPDAARRDIRLPFLWVFGRRDFTISIMGANIYPEDIEQCVYADPELARITRSFCQRLSEGPDGSVRPCFLFEIDADSDVALVERFTESVLQSLLSVNADFCAAWNECPSTLRPLVELFRVGKGPFQLKPGQIKQRRLLKH
jgi:phenylacetate-CoA ligase